MNRNKQKLVTIVGPTASGKTDWGIKLAEQFSGEVVSADSRKVYKYMNIGTATPQGELIWFLGPQSYPQRTYKVENINHYLINWINPDINFNLAKFQKKAKKYIGLIHKKDKIPFLVGGSGLYIQSVVDNYNIPSVPPQQELRSTLEEFSCSDIIKLLEQVDPESVDNINHNNKRRLIRAFEVSVSVGKPFSQLKNQNEKIYNTLQIGIKRDREKLYSKINSRVEHMFDQGLKAEVKQLLDMGYSWRDSSMDSIGYQEFKRYFSGNKKLQQIKKDIKTNTRNYAKRQMSWLRRDDRIQWCSSINQAKDLVENFLST